ncbi:SusC/RagA family TonB-linked outer membrane protein [Flavobacteriaceae bacterium TK19130]|nr:SusC/RagA family TonB-linked outer membrane protein [Thermobacterium salinum]
MKTKFSGILTLLLALVVQLSFAQVQTITGTVTDDGGLPLPGANVIVKGTATGTQTDFDGNYSISARQGQTLVYSYVGFQTQEVAVGNQTSIDISLQVGNQLDEVVITTYGGNVTQRELTTSVAKPDIETVQSVTSSNVASALQGTTSGTQISTLSGAPGGEVSIRIRGASTINGNSNPLFVIDGIPMFTGVTRSNNFGGQQNSALSNLNPNEIESIRILKDAAATAVYGQRGSNGVVEITTKKGKSGKLSININNSVGFQTALNKYEKMDYGQWLNYRDTYAENSGAPSGSFSANDADRPDLEGASDAVLQAFYDSVSDVGDSYMDAVYVDEAPIIENNVSFSGGSEKTKFFFTASRFDQEGTVLTQDFVRKNARLNITQEITEDLTFDGGIGIADESSRAIVNDNNIFGVLSTALLERPGLDLRQENGDFTPYTEFTISNPLQNALSDFGEGTTFRVIGNAGLNYSITDDFSAAVKFGLDQTEYRERIFNPASTAQGNFGISNDEGTPGLSQETHTSVRIWLVRPSLSYNTNITDGIELRAYLGSEYERRWTKFVGALSEGFTSPGLTYVSQGIFPITTSASFSEEIRTALIGTLGFTLWDKLILEGSIRRDDNSKFREDDRTGYFPGASAAYILSNESWFENNFLTYMKLRGSWGITGNDSPFARYTAPVTATDLYGEAQTTFLTIGSQSARWEETEQIDVGFDSKFFDGVLGLGYSYYLKRTNDRSLVVNDFTALNQGNRSVVANIAEMENKGHEIDLNITPFNTEDFYWSNTFNFSTLDNEVTFLPKDAEGNTRPIDAGFVNRVDEGEPLGYFYVFEADGLYQEGDVIPQDLVDQGVGPGDVRYVDQNGDGLINDEDRINGGDAWADFTLNWQGNVRYKNFDLNFLWAWSEGNEIFNNNLQFAGISGSPNFGKLSNQLDWWTPTNTDTDIPRPNQVTQGYNNQESTRFVEDGSYIKLRNITLGYTLPEIKGLDKVRVYVSADNLVLITDYSGVDPEVNTFGNTNISRGTDFLSQGGARVLKVGMNLSF